MKRFILFAVLLVATIQHWAQGPGCTDPDASNYDFLAIEDDGSCVWCNPNENVMTIEFFGDANIDWSGVSYSFTDGIEGIVVAAGSIVDLFFVDGNEYAWEDICLPNGCYVFQLYNVPNPEELFYTLDNPFDGFALTYPALVESIAIVFNDPVCDVDGCTDPEAYNYNPYALIDDGNCAYFPDPVICDGIGTLTCGASVSGTTMDVEFEPIPDWNTCGVDIDGPGRWYQIVGTGGQIALSTCNPATSFDTRISVFSIDENCAILDCIGGNENGANCPDGGSVFAFNSESNVTYLIYLHGSNGQTGSFLLDVICNDCSDFAPNDDCLGTITLDSGVPVNGSLCCANPEDPNLCTPQGMSAYGVWYKLNSGDCDTFEFNLENLGGENITMTIFEDTQSLGCAGLTEVACCPVVEDFCQGDLSLVTIQPNTDYYFFVYATDPINCGNYQFEVLCGYYGCTDPFNCNYDPEATIDDASCTFECDCAETNQSCFEAVEIECGYEQLISMYCVGFSGPLSATGCDLVQQSGLWYSFTGDGSDVVLSSCGTEGPSRIDVFTTSTGTCLGEFSCAVDAGTGEYVSATNNQCDNDTELDFETTPGETYYVYVSSPSLVFINFSMSCSTAGDFTGDGEVDVSDLLILLGQVGCSENCTTDLNGDGIVNVWDVLLFLGLF